jgi:transcriptional regulator with XRE-family HTH domain
MSALTEGHMVGRLSPLLRRQELGHRLRQLRLQAHLTIGDVADHLMVSETKISRLESGARGVRPRDIRDLCALYNANEDDRRQLMGLVRQSHERAWWQEYSLPFSALVDFETSAVAIADYKSAIIPGLLQTEDYAVQMLSARVPSLAPDILARRLAARIARQYLLDDRSVNFRFVLDEAVLHRTVGGPTVMHEQLRRLLGRSEQPNIEIRVLPYSAGAHPALESNFTLIEFAAGEAVPAIVYVEGLLGNNYLKGPADVRRYRNVLDSLMRHSLTAPASVDLIRSLHYSA